MIILTPSLPQPVQFPGQKMHGRACKQYTFWSYNTSAFSAMRFDENLFHLPVRKRKPEGLRVSNFTLWMVIFKWHHGSTTVMHLVIILKENRCKQANLTRKCANISTYRLHCVALSVSTQKYFFFTWEFVARKKPCSFFASEEQKKAGLWRISLDTFATCSSPVRVTDKAAGHKNSSARSQVFTTLKCQRI